MVQQNTVSRRAVAKGVAWSAPAVLATSAVPAFALSCKTHRFLLSIVNGTPVVAAQDGSGATYPYTVTLEGVSGSGVLAGDVSIDFGTQVTDVAFTLGGFDSKGEGNVDRVTFPPNAPVTYGELSNVVTENGGRTLRAVKNEKNGTAGISYSPVRKIEFTATNVLPDNLTISAITFTACI